MNRGVVFWRFIWLLPASFFVMVLLSPIFTFNDDIQGAGFIIIRVLLYMALVLVCYFFEMSVRQMAEAEAAQRQAEELAETNKFLDSLSNMKSEYLSNLAHDIRTPLTVLSLNVQKASDILDEGGETKKIQKALKNVSEETSRLIRMANAALDLASMKENKGRMAGLDIALLLSDCTEAHKPFIEKRGNSLTLNIQGRLPPIEGAPDLIVQVISNLLSNANAHTQNGEIAIDASADEEALTIVVRDNGEGVAQGLKHRAFERGISGRGGTGLGLHLCKSIVESHGGIIELNSAQGQGTAVTITLPVYSNRGGKV